MNFFKIIFCITLLLVTAGCGFHLRGTTQLPDSFQNIAIVIKQGHPDLTKLLNDTLTAIHHSVTTTQHARFWLVIEHDDLQQNIASISSSTTPRQYLLVYSLTFKLIDNDKEIIPTNKIIITRPLTVNSDRILGSNDEERQLLYAMHQQAVQEIIYRLSARL